MKKDFIDLLKTTKIRLLSMHYEANAGHIGGNLSCIDAMMTLHHLVMKEDDRFILSKGHSAGALYATLWSQNKLSDNDLKSFTKDNTRLPGHPSGSGIPGLLFSTGSLGHGPSLAAGLALAAKYRNSDRQIYCLCSDGEWQEGSCWEALTLAVHQRLNNLIILIDQNGLQGFGTTEEVISCGTLTPKLSAFGAYVQDIDGHDHNALETAINNRSKSQPNLIVMNTVKGKGLHFEGQMESHYLPLTKEQYKNAVESLDGGATT